MTVSEAAKLLGVDDQTIRIGIRTGQLPIGFCVGNGRRKSYIIPNELFTKVTGKEVLK